MNIHVTIREATEGDLEQMVHMLADDVLGRKRERYEKPLPVSYVRAFKEIKKDKNNELIVACNGEEIVGMLQVTFTPYLTYQGSWRATIEGVRTHSAARGQGIGSQLVCWAIERAKERGCHLIQLTTDKQRPDALRFYEQLGFKASHEGLKMHF
ncbi:GNAT family N-acetyltransferase [Halalkalibacterium halodurans]|uniref:Transcriptional regulator n=1 Tax=Halalkalibacterium halodurans (strain ATCC BAA-125 / DSM 18197 / FERM 7344 / JCM 9153 / C-125) TaxID=272558 RepID=Q9KBG0_HALH5|nr:GNAT family N-acetyltransferase [Halalkalibacterium halodurans]1Z4E_A Chain A, transcriptional regulator [Halalkalibacterium halodurans C-125]1Z4E_B Chain B, transcriptional regulator [Halalkalibacterium halodurans C-125]MDY7222526.1 GNAT family N-acetyltransferase [Halalkalibacterium halodurans]MDY7241747.1 GNAT family N-acetyltransferase [Halalkalibacterium halodurans]MED3648833.1 GNAT family N-acetyltransferase [Halalkalibacterium halodurans]MED4082628.1 GNAT family N-acetyltransferase 